MSEITDSAKPMKQEDPRPRKKGYRGSNSRTLARRAQLTNNPGQWFVWKENAKTAGDTGQALRTLLGLTSIKGLDRKALPFESTSRVNEDKTWCVYVRYVGEDREYANA
jgi:hypothetical protein